MISNYIHYKVWGEILFPNFNSRTIEVREWLSIFITPFIIDVHVLI